MNTKCSIRNGSNITSKAITLPLILKKFTEVILQCLNQVEPTSVYLAEGSEISVENKRKIQL